MGQQRGNEGQREASTFWGRMEMGDYRSWLGMVQFHRRLLLPLIRSTISSEHTEQVPELPRFDTRVNTLRYPGPYINLQSA